MKITDLLGEATEYDKKQAVEHKKVKSWLKSVSAFANTAGGTLIFGITDGDSEFISQKIKERISPFPEVIMKLHKTEDEKELLLLQIPAGAETPYYYTGDGVTEAYIRIGNESVVADATELKRLVMRGRNSSYDALMMHPFAGRVFSVQDGMDWIRAVDRLMLWIVPSIQVALLFF